MLNKDAFNKGIEKLIREFGDRGFTMTKEKAEDWYNDMKDFTDKHFLRLIDATRKNCNHVPYLADVLNIFKGREDEEIYTPEEIAEFQAQRAKMWETIEPGWKEQKTASGLWIVSGSL